MARRVSLPLVPTRRAAVALLFCLLAGCESFQEGPLVSNDSTGGRSELTQMTMDWFGSGGAEKPAPAAAAPIGPAPPAPTLQTPTPSRIVPPRPLPTPAARAAPAPAPAGRGGSDYDAALGVYRPLAMDGQAFAQFEMGRLYESGQGVPRDVETAKVWYRRAAAQNDRNAVTALARLDTAAAPPPAAPGSGGPALALVAPTEPAMPSPPELLAPPGAPAPSDPSAEASIPPQPAAPLPYSVAPPSVAPQSAPPPTAPSAPTSLEPLRPPESYSDGIAAFNARDYAAAARLWEPRAQRGDSNSQTRLGYLYEHGLGVAADHAKAVEWYRRAAEQDDPAGAFNLAVMYRKGQGVPRDDLAARQWYGRAARAGHPIAPHVLALMDEAGLGMATPAPAN